MDRRRCHHCKNWIEQGEAHDCWTTTEAALTRDLTTELLDAWERLRDTAAQFGQQRIYASGHAIMFARKICYFFVRPRKQFLEVCVFLGRELKASQVRRVDRVSKSKLVHVIRVTHRDEVETPLTDWLREAFETCDELPIENAALKKNPQQREAKNDQMAKRFAPGAKGPKAGGDDRTQLRRVRSICGSIAGAIEKISHGEPTFFTPKRVFAMFANNHHGDGHVAVWVPAAPGVQAALIDEAPNTYFRPPYVGAAGWVGVELSCVDDDRLRAIVGEAFRLMTAKTIAKSRSVAARPTRPVKAPRRPPTV